MNNFCKEGYILKNKYGKNDRTPKSHENLRSLRFKE